MKKYIEAEAFVKYMEKHNHTYGRAARKYASEHAVDAVAVGDTLDGCVIEVHKTDDGKFESRLRAYSGKIEDLVNGSVTA